MKRISLALLVLQGVLCGQPGPTHGQASGHPTSGTVSVWTRASGPALVSVLYGTHPLLVGAQETAAVLVGAATDFTVRIDLAGLQPETTYSYRIRYADPGNPQSQTLGVVGKLQTSPLADAVVAQTVAFAADIHDHAHYGLFGAMLAQAPNLGLLLGDFPYADAQPAATTLAAYRAKHQVGRDEATIQAFLAGTTISATWDDHEVQNDWDAATDPSRVALGRAVWKEYFPMRPSGDAIYHSVRLGKGAELFVLDTRSYRGINSAPDVVGKTLLGAAQLQWLLNGLANSTAIFKVVCSSVPLRYGTTNKDHWQGYMRERQQLMDWITTQRIANVVFVSGDQHWSAIHHHREGVKEFQACPLATSLRTPPAEPEAEVVSIFSVRSYGILRVRPAASPPELVVEIRDASGIISTSSLSASAPGAVQMALGHPDGAFQLQGPHRFRNQGGMTTFPYAPAGVYSATFTPPSPLVAAPDPWTVALPPGGFLSGAADFSVTDDPLHPTLFRDDFDTAGLSAWTVVDEGTIDAPSAWFQDDHRLVQSSNIYGGSTAASVAEKPGTSLQAGDFSWTDYTFRFEVKSQDDDGIGAMFRLAADGSCYRFAMDAQRSFRRLTRTLGGVTTVLAEVAGGYTHDHWYSVTIKAIGANLSVALDGETILTATDGALAAGKIALYTWGSQVVWFDHVVVQEGDVPPALSGALFAEDFSSGGLIGWTAVDQGTVSAPSAWSVQNGECVQSSNIYGGSLAASVPDKPGTFLVTGDPAWTDTVTSLRLRNDDNDALGVMFRVVDGNNHYRFSMDSERSYRRLTRTLNGFTVILAEDGGTYLPGTWHDVVVRAEGPSLRVAVDGLPILSVTDATFPSGRVALYSWGSVGARFDDVLVGPPLPRPPCLVAHGLAHMFQIDVFAGAFPGFAYQLALSLGNTPGIPLAALNPLDPRIVPLVADPLFFLSLTPSVTFGGFGGALDVAGHATATVNVPPSVGLSGFSLFASGVLFEPSALSGIITVLPSLPITLP